MTTPPQERRLTLRLPPVLAKQIDKDIYGRKGAERKFSLNDWFIEAAREKLGLAETRNGAAVVAGLASAGTGRGDPASIQGVIRGSTLFGAPASKGWAGQLPRIDQEGEQDPAGALEKMRQLAGEDVELPRDWPRWGIDKKIRFMDESYPL